MHLGILAITFAVFALSLPALGEEIYIHLEAAAPTPQMVSSNATETQVRDISVVVKKSNGDRIRRDDDAYGMIWCEWRTPIRSTCEGSLELANGLYKIVATHDGRALVNGGKGGMLRRRSVSVEFTGSIVFADRRRDAQISARISPWPSDETVGGRTCVERPNQCSTIKAFAVR